jgi:hypothetical protein
MAEWAGLAYRRVIAQMAHIVHVEQMVRFACVSLVRAAVRCEEYPSPPGVGDAKLVQPSCDTDPKACTPQAAGTTREAIREVAAALAAILRAAGDAQVERGSTKKEHER